LQKRIIDRIINFNPVGALKNPVRLQSKRGFEHLNGEGCSQSEWHKSKRSIPRPLISGQSANSPNLNYGEPLWFVHGLCLCASERTLGWDLVGL